VGQNPNASLNSVVCRANCRMMPVIELVSTCSRECIQISQTQTNSDPPKTQPFPVSEAVFFTAIGFLQCVILLNLPIPMAVLEQDSSIFLIFPSTLWLFNIAMEAMADRNRWFTELKNGGSFHGYVK